VRMFTCGPLPPRCPRPVGLRAHGGRSAARRGSSRNRRRAAPRLSEPAPGPSSRVEPAT
jgi:hypothetical protein